MAPTDPGTLPGALRAAVDALTWPSLFATVSGAHLYGFPSPDSDWDLRGCHLLPAREFLRLSGPRDETITIDRPDPELHLDLVSHDLRKFLMLLGKSNGNVLEQLHSPLVVQTTPAHAELQDLARRCLTRDCSHHYRGFAHQQWELFETERPCRAKPLLYVFRVLLTGIHLLNTGRVVCDLDQLLDDRSGFDDLRELAAAKRAHGENSTVDDAEVTRQRQRFQDLHDELVAARDRSPLPAKHDALPALDDYLLRARTAAPADFS